MHHTRTLERDRFFLGTWTHVMPTWTHSLSMAILQCNGTHEGQGWPDNCTTQHYFDVNGEMSPDWPRGPAGGRPGASWGRFWQTNPWSYFGLIRMAGGNGHSPGRGWPYSKGISSCSLFLLLFRPSPMDENGIQRCSSQPWGEYEVEEATQVVILSLVSLVTKFPLGRGNTGTPSAQGSGLCST